MKAASFYTFSLFILWIVFTNAYGHNKVVVVPLVDDGAIAPQTISSVVRVPINSTFSCPISQDSSFAYSFSISTDDQIQATRVDNPVLLAVPRPFIAINSIPENFGSFGLSFLPFNPPLENPPILPPSINSCSLTIDPVDGVSSIAESFPPNALVETGNPDIIFLNANDELQERVEWFIRVSYTDNGAGTATSITLEELVLLRTTEDEITTFCREEQLTCDF